jgi:GNAT superfamily N-acetyltransferase
MEGLDLKRVAEDDLPDVKGLLLAYNPDAVIRGRYYMAVEDSVIKGVIGILWRSWYLTELRHLYVRLGFRRNGVGKFLVEEAMKWVKTPLICCTVGEGNYESLRLFEREGFSVVRSFVNPETENQVSLLMRLREE